MVLIFVSLPKRGQQKIHGCGTVLKIWRNPVLLKKMGALSGRRGEERASIGGKRRRVKRKRQRNLSRISEAKIRQLVKLFSVDLTASQIAELSGVNRNTVNRYVTAFRERIARYCEAESPVKGEVEVDESYFGARRVRGIRGRGARGKTIVFGLFKRNDNVYTEIVPDCSRATLQGIIRGRVDLESVIHSDGWRGYDGLVDLGYQKHFRVQHSHNEFSNKHSHINGIESFWSYAKTRLVRFRGLQKQTFYLHLKECEFRFNHRQEDIYLLVLKLLRACLETHLSIMKRFSSMLAMAI